MRRSPQKMLSNCRMAYMIWTSKREKGAAGDGLARASERCLAASVDVLAEEIEIVAPLCG